MKKFIPLLILLTALSVMPCFANTGTSTLGWTQDVVNDATGKPIPAPLKIQGWNIYGRAYVPPVAPPAFVKIMNFPYSGTPAASYTTTATITIAPNVHNAIDWEIKSVLSDGTESVPSNVVTVPDAYFTLIPATPGTLIIQGNVVIQ